MTLQSTAAGHVVQLRGQTLVERARKMDPGAWEEIFAANHDAIYRYLLRRLGNRDVAEDVAADVFLNAVRGIERFRYQGIALRAWLYGIAHHLAVDHVRREVRRANSSGTLPGPTEAGGFADQVADRAEVVHALQYLTDEQQHVIVLRFFEGLSVAEVARVTQRREGAVKALQHRALRRMRSILTDGRANHG
ncbi:MAG: sigma-70 family RNA polymerase sigma factor [Dehalococcoidia bacterium]|nr:sigma-70 family RNA polymerase sigma factor [Dehalococcoidia bacterium]MCA9853798.1 sigma-70 family RNA polymerase sigma factor [Dehalococcoidia bacterium]